MPPAAPDRVADAADDISAVYAGRSDITNNVFPHESLNLLGQQYTDGALFEKMRRVLIDSDNLFGPAQVIPTVTDQIKLIRQLRQNHRCADRQTLLHIQTKYAEPASWFYQEYGDNVTAEYWSSRDLEWSHGVHDHDGVHLGSESSTRW